MDSVDVDVDEGGEDQQGESGEVGELIGVRGATSSGAPKIPSSVMYSVPAR